MKANEKNELIKNQYYSTKFGLQKGFFSSQFGLRAVCLF